MILTFANTGHSFFLFREKREASQYGYYEAGQPPQFGLNVVNEGGRWVRQPAQQAQARIRQLNTYPMQLGLRQPLVFGNYRNQPQAQQSFAYNAPAAAPYVLARPAQQGFGRPHDYAQHMQPMSYSYPPYPQQEQQSSNEGIVDWNNVTHYSEVGPNGEVTLIPAQLSTLQSVMTRTDPVWDRWRNYSQYVSASVPDGRVEAMNRLLGNTAVVSDSVQPLYAPASASFSQPGVNRSSSVSAASRRTASPSYSPSASSSTSVESVRKQQDAVSQQLAALEEQQKKTESQDKSIVERIQTMEQQMKELERQMQEASRKQEAEAQARNKRIEEITQKAEKSGDFTGVPNLIRELRQANQQDQKQLLEFVRKLGTQVAERRETARKLLSQSVELQSQLKTNVAQQQKLRKQSQELQASFRNMNTR